jgi:putative FmdB family regulatory protein
MPIYEYRCLDCGKTFEAIQKFSDEPYTTCGQSTVDCDKGGSGNVERLLGSPAFHFKGSGFYITDYNKSASSQGSSSTTKSDTSTSTPASTPSTTKSDS